eukprot:TRINITY_DN17589_c0_g1_i7.p1 TRINITY_DN17589_c0_g1~~TRINITY_DN17589_c0_g1_i7.p1  ORF type:complete len:498 (+),score=71.56 TRINITY_DN17589_c0_g1_i7:274-1767(+)
MDHLPKLGRRQRWLRAGRKHAVMSMWRALVALGVCAFLLGLTMGSAFAFGTVANSGTTEQTVWYASPDALNYSTTGESGPHSSVEAACASSMSMWVARRLALANRNVVLRGYDGSGDKTQGNCQELWDDYLSNGTKDGTYDNSGRTRQATITVPGCPSGSTAGGGSCTCNEGLKPNTGATACVATNCSAAVAYLDLMASSAMESSGLSTTQCYDGCNITGDMASQGADGKYYLYGPYRTDGGYCNGGGDGKTVEPAGAPSACVKPQCPGTVNGTTGCYPCGTTATETKQNAESVNTPASGASSPGGSTSTSQQTICINGSCTTTTTTTVTNVDGSKTTTTTSGDKPTTDMGGFCKENPGSPICKNSSFGGACAGGFQCDGDAVQCAIAREQHTRNCALYVTETPQSTAGYSALTAGDRPGDHPANDPTAEALDFSGRIDQTDRLGGGSLTDLTIPVGNLAPVVISFSQLQSPLAMLGNLLVGVTMLWALFIVFGRAK